MYVAYMTSPGERSTGGELTSYGLPYSKTHFCDGTSRLLTGREPSTVILTAQYSARTHLTSGMVHGNVPLLLRGPITASRRNCGVLVSTTGMTATPVFVSFPLHFTDVTLMTGRVISSNGLNPVTDI